MEQNRKKLFDSPTWQIYRKTTNRNKRKCWHGFGNWGLVINNAQLFCMNERIWYPINSLERQSVILEMTASAAFGKQTPSNLKITDHFTCTSANVIYFITCTYCGGSLENRMCTNFFLEDTHKQVSVQQAPVEFSAVKRKAYEIAWCADTHLSKAKN